jgi:hypothetical protein
LPNTEGGSIWKFEPKAIHLYRQNKRLGKNISMKIANPIYDAVFKYLMTDIDIAKDLLSAILKVDIVSLEIQPQELPINISSGISVMRIDFKAKIRLASGDFKIILIEIQKAKRHYNILRFRRYIGKNYRETEQVVQENGDIEEVNLPITTIYFLGYKLDHIEFPVLKVGRIYQNAVTGETIDVKEDFVEQLSHDMYAIQIPRLKMDVQTELEKMLDVFSQDKYKTNESHVLEYTGDTKNPKIARMLKRLNSVFLDEETLRAIEAEEEIEGEIELLNRQLERSNLAKEEERKAKEGERKAKEEERKAKDEERKAKELLAIENEALKQQIELLLKEKEQKS